MIRRALIRSTKNHKTQGESRQPYGDLVEINTSRVLLDAVGREDLADIVSNCMDRLDTSVAIYEKNGDYAFLSLTSNWCRLLDQASRRLCDTDDNRKALESGAWHCHESRWTEASKFSIEAGRQVDTKCIGGRRICAAPIWAGEQIVGSICIGYGNPVTDTQKLQKIAMKYGVEVCSLRRHAKAHKPLVIPDVDAARSRLTTLARLIGTIVERKKTNEALRETNDRFRAVFENVKDAIFWANPRTGFIINCNKAVETLLERKRREIIGHPHTIIHPPEKAEYYTRMFREHMKQRESAYEADVVTKSGKTKTVHVSASVIQVGGEPIVQGVFQDVTEQKRTDRELRNYSRRLQELAEERTVKLLEAERMAAISEVAGVVGYDLSNALGVITSAIRTAKVKISSMSTQHRSYVEKMGAWDLLRKMEEKADYVEKIVSDLQDYAGPLKPRLVETRVRQLVYDALSTTRVPETVKVSVRIDRGFPKVMLDPRMMKRALSNIITNAVQAMPNGGDITIHASKKANLVYLSIRDTGVGVPEEILDKLFLPLFTTKPNGTGFGLPVCKRMIENHGGDITVESKLNECTTVIIRLPYRKRTG